AGAMPLCQDIPKLIGRRPFTFVDSHGFVVFKRDSELVDSPDASTSKEHAVDRAGKNEVAPGVSKAGVHNDVMKLNGQVIYLNVLPFTRGRREAYNKPSCLFGTHSGPQR